VQTKTARKRASRDMKIAILDACRDNLFRKLDGVARGLALIDASHEVSTADAVAPINNGKVPDHFQAYVLKYALGSFTCLARYRFMVLPFHHSAPQRPVAQTANLLP
jgi:hypothetical protein